MKTSLAEVSHDIRHLAIIMDGNGRFAKAKGLVRHLGHKEGIKKISRLIDDILELRIGALSLFAFSTENWNRPQDEIDHLFAYLEEFLEREKMNMLQKGVHLMISGDYTKLPASAVTKIDEVTELTKDNHRLVLNICLNYGGRDDIVRASKIVAELVHHQQLDINEIDEEILAQCLYTAELPDVDLLIRTSGEFRISNFLLWQLAYAELVFLPVNWPDFQTKDLLDAIKVYNNRDRRHGAIKDGNN